MLESNSSDEGYSGKFEQLDKPSSVSDLIEHILFKDFNSLIFFKNIFFACVVLLDASSGSAFRQIQSSLTKSSQVSLNAGLKPLCPVYSTFYSCIARFV